MPRFTVTPERPYSLALTAERFRRFPEVIDRFDGKSYRRLVFVDKSPLLVVVTQTGPPRHATLDVSLQGKPSRTPEARRVALHLVEESLGTRVAVAPFYKKLARDPIVGDALRAFRGLRAAGWADPWEALVTTVLSQQVNLKFAYDIRRELTLAFGRRARFDGETYFGFPAPERIAKEGARKLLKFRLSRAKAGTIARLARAFATGALSRDALDPLSDDDALAKLTAVKGVGRWTAEITLLRCLGRVDAFPAGDLGVVKYLAQGLLKREERATEKEMRRFAEAWRPYRGLALVYAYAELSRRKL